MKDDRICPVRLVCINTLSMVSQVGEIEEMNRDTLEMQYSDLWKDVYGSRPRHLSRLSTAELQLELPSLIESWQDSVKSDAIEQSAYLKSAQEALTIHLFRSKKAPINNPFHALKSV